MLRLFLSLTPANLLHEFGSGRALDNALREREEVERMTAVIDALVGRLEVATTPVASLEKKSVAA